MKHTYAVVFAQSVPIGVGRIVEREGDTVAYEMLCNSIFPAKTPEPGSHEEAEAIERLTEKMQAIADAMNGSEDLLDACQAATRAMGEHGPCRNNSCADCGRIWKQIHAAIAKAKGAQS